jgi:hypothetical protein
VNSSLPPGFHPSTLSPPKKLGDLIKEINIEADPHGKDQHAPGAKLDSGKLKPWLFYAGFARALEEVARVTTKGAEKYTENGWLEVPDGKKRYMEAFGRHMVSLAKGEVMDDSPKGLGSDIYHKAQMIWNLLASLELELREKNVV